MSEKKKELISQKGLMIIGIVSLAILILGIILYYTGLNNAFYVSRYSVQSIFKAITYLGEPVVFIIIIAILFLIYNKTYAKSLAYSLLFSYYLNGVFKEYLKILALLLPIPPVLIVDLSNPIMDFHPDMPKPQYHFGDMWVMNLKTSMNTKAFKLYQLFYLS